MKPEIWLPSDFSTYVHTYSAALQPTQMSIRPLTHTRTATHINQTNITVNFFNNVKLVARCIIYQEIQQLLKYLKLLFYMIYS